MTVDGHNTTHQLSGLESRSFNARAWRIYPRAVSSHVQPAIGGSLSPACQFSLQASRWLQGEEALAAWVLATTLCHSFGSRGWQLLEQTHNISPVELTAGLSLRGISRPPKCLHTLPGPDSSQFSYLEPPTWRTRQPATSSSKRTSCPVFQEAPSARSAPSRQLRL